MSLIKKELALWFSDWKWMRKFIGGTWVRINEPGYMWVQWRNDPYDPLIEDIEITGRFSVERYT